MSWVPVAAWVIGVGAMAQGDPRMTTSAWMPMDGGAMCAMLAKDLRGAAVHDLVTVTAGTAVEKKTDSFEVFVTPGGGVDGGAPRVDLVLGPLHVHTDGHVVRAVHTRAPDTVFEAPMDGKSVLEVIAEVAPPIPMPQVWMAMSDAGEGTCPSLGPYLGAVKWVKAEMGVDMSPPQARMYGRAEGTNAAVEVYATLEPVRIDRIVVTQEKETSAIEIRIAPLEAGAKPPEDVMEGRKKVGSVGELVGEKKAGE